MLTLNILSNINKMITEENDDKGHQKDSSPSSKYQTPRQAYIPPKINIALKIPDVPFLEIRSSLDGTPNKKNLLNTPKGPGTIEKKQSFSSKMNELDISDIAKDRRSSIQRDYSYSPSKPINRQIIGDNYDPLRIERLLKKFPRQPHEAKRLAEFLTKWNPYFRSLTEGENGLSIEAIFQICQKIEFEEYKAGKAVIKEGDPSNKKFYVIYSGEAAVVVKKLNVYMEMNMRTDNSMKKSFKPADESKIELPSSSSSSSSSSSESEEEPPVVEIPSAKRRPSRMSMTVPEEDLRPKVTNSARKSIFAPSKIQSASVEVLQPPPTLNLNSNSLNPSLTVNALSPSHGHEGSSMKKSMQTISLTALSPTHTSEALKKNSTHQNNTPVTSLNTLSPTNGQEGIMKKSSFQLSALNSPSVSLNVIPPVLERSPGPKISFALSSNNTPQLSDNPPSMRKPALTVNTSISRNSAIDGLPSIDSPGTRTGNSGKTSLLKIPVAGENYSPTRPRPSFSFKGNDPAIRLLPTNGMTLSVDSNPMKNSRRRLSSMNVKFFQEQQLMLQKAEPKKKVKKVKSEDEIREESMQKLQKYGHVKDIIYKDFAFGERALIDDTARGATIFTLLPTQLLVIKTEEFKLIQKNYEPEKKRILEFMIKTFPDLDQINQVETVRDYIYLLEKRSYDTGNSIVQEGDAGEIFYLLYQGHIELTKQIYIKEKIQSIKFAELNTHMRVKPNFKSDIKICNVETPGTFLCEEILFEKRSKYHYTIKALSSPVILFAVNKKYFWNRATPTTKTMMQKNFMEKCRERVDLIHRKIEMKYSDPKITFESLGDNESPFDEKFMNETQIVRDLIIVETQEKGSSIKSKLKMKSLANKIQPPKNEFKLEIQMEPASTASGKSTFRNTTTNFRNLATVRTVTSAEADSISSTQNTAYLSFKSPRNLKASLPSFPTISNEPKDKKAEGVEKSGSQNDVSNMQSRDYEQLKSILELGNDIKIASGRVPKKLIMKRKEENDSELVRSEGYEIATLEKNYLMSPTKRVTSPKTQYDQMFPVEEIDKFRLDAAEIDDRMQKRFAIQKLLELPRKNLPKSNPNTERTTFTRIQAIRDRIKVTSNTEFSAIDTMLRSPKFRLPPPVVREDPPSPIIKDDDGLEFFLTSQDFRLSTLREKEKKKKVPGMLKPPSLWNLESINSLPAENEMPNSAERQTIYIGNPPNKNEKPQMKNFTQSEMLKFKHKTNNRLKTKLTILTTREALSPRKYEGESPRTVPTSSTATTSKYTKTQTQANFRPNTQR